APRDEASTGGAPMTTSAKSTLRMSAAAAAMTCLLAATPPARAQDEAANLSQTVPSHELIVSAGKSQVLELSQPYSDVMVADPKIADVLPLNRHAVYVVGKSAGATALTIYGPGH